MSKEEKPFFHSELRRLSPAVTNVPVHLEPFMGRWVRVVVRDGRSFVGSLAALDRDLNMVLLNPVEVRPVSTKAADQGEPVEEAAETKSHRGTVMIGNSVIVSVGLYSQPQPQQNQ